MEPTATLAIAPKDDFPDFVPIKNNAADFVLDVPLDTFDDEIPLPEELAQIPGKDLVAQENIPLVTNQQNIMSSVNFPAIPKNNFANCNVMINYNFYSK